jgi:hypothetical protein
MKKTIFFLALGLASMTAAAQTSFLERADLARDGEFRRRVQAAAIEACYNVLSDTTEYGLTVRGLAEEFVVNPTNVEAINRFAVGVARNPVITSQSSDSDIAFALSEVLLPLAQAYNSRRLGVRVIPSPPGGAPN